MRFTLRRVALSGAFLTAVLAVSGVFGVSAAQAISSGRFSGFTSPGSGPTSTAGTVVTVIVGAAVLGLIAYVALALDRRARPELHAVEDSAEGAGTAVGASQAPSADEEEERRRAA